MMSENDQPSVRSLTCAVCGGEARGRQWKNRDNGYGVCVRCADANTARYGEGDDSTGLDGDTTRALFGVRGYHFAVDEPHGCHDCTVMPCPLARSSRPRINCTDWVA